jgi:sulfite reductase alpha subunit-like flavoprotein
VTVTASCAIISLEAFEKEGVCDLRLAFSREQQEKVYVQNVLAREENAREAWRMIDAEGGSVYVCGGTAMGADVHNALLRIVGAQAKLDASKTVAYVDKMKAEGRYVQELWA